MTERHVEIDLTGHTGRLVLDGHDLTDGIQCFTLRGGNQELPKLEIEPLVLTGRVEGQQAEVILYLPDETRQALIMQGWTPPPGDD